MAGYSHRTAQPPILAVFLPWGGSAGAGRVRPAGANVGQIEGFTKRYSASFILPTLSGTNSHITNNLVISCSWSPIIKE